MISLLLSFIVLIIGYLIYSRITNKVFAPDSRRTPAIAYNDGVDCVPLRKGKSFLIQLLNIAGTGPIFGALMGAVFGPVVFLWIVFGSILGGAVHDFMVGMISSRHKGASIAELSGLYIGKVVKWIMRIFSVILLILCGTVFIITPATLLADLTPTVLNKWFWIGIIIFYYFLATILPIDKIIGKLYPVFGILLIGMAFGVIVAVFAQGYSVNIPEIWNGFGLKNPNGLPTWPFMFVTVACGAISGFHATQSPMMSKCIENEKQGRQVFYGAMITESVIALIWAAAGVAVYGSTQALQDALKNLGGAGPVVHDICTKLLGSFGAILAIIGVVVCPITSGDTAFRSARLIIAETLKLDQKKVKNRLLITTPLIAIGVALCFLDFEVLWRYFSFANQTLAMIALWVATIYLLKKGKYLFSSFITAIPASFMVAVSVTYILLANEGFKLINYGANGLIISYSIGGGLAVASLIAYIIIFNIYFKKKRKYRLHFFSSLKMERELAILQRDVVTIIADLYGYRVKKEDFGRLLNKLEKSPDVYNKDIAKYFKRKRHDKLAIKMFELSFNRALKYGAIIADSKQLNSYVIIYPIGYSKLRFLSFNGLKFFFYSLFHGCLITYFKFKRVDEQIMMFKEHETMNIDFFIFDLMSFDKKKVKIFDVFKKFVKDNNRAIFAYLSNSNSEYILEKEGFKLISNERYKPKKDPTRFAYLYK